MDHGKEKLMIALLVGLVAMVTVLFLLSTSNTHAASLAVSTADNNSSSLQEYEWITVTTSPISAQPAVTWGNQVTEDNAEACTIAVATGSSTVDGRPVLWKNRDYFEKPGTWQAILFWHEPTGQTLSASYPITDRLSYVAVSDRADRTDRSSPQVITETLYYPRMGANERGLAVVSAEAHTLRNNGSQNDDGVNNGGLNHWILSRCETITEVQELLTATNNGSEARDTASLIAVIDRFGGAAIFEVDGDSFARENITKEFSGVDPRPDEKDAPNPPDGGYNGYDYRSNFSHIEFTKPDGFEYFLDECTNEVISDAVVCTNGPDGIDDREDSPSSVKRWKRVEARMDDCPKDKSNCKDYQYFIQKWLRLYAHPRENYLETLARSVGYAPYLTSQGTDRGADGGGAEFTIYLPIIMKNYPSPYLPPRNWVQEKPTGWHLNRFVTVSSAVIVGRKAEDQDEGKLTTMWVALGEPSVAIFVPVFPYAGQPPAVLNDFFLSVNAKRRLVYDYETDADGYPVDNIDDTSCYTRLRNYDHSIDLSALFGGNYYGEGGLQAYNFAIEEQLFREYSTAMGDWRTWTATQITPLELASWQETQIISAVEEYVWSDPIVVVYEAETDFGDTCVRSTTTNGITTCHFSTNGYISRTHYFTGPTIIEVIAKGTPDGGDWPRMKVSVNNTCLTGVGGETEADCTVIVSPTHATNKAKSVDGDLDDVTSRFALYRYRINYTGMADLRVEVVSTTGATAVDIDKVLLRTEPRSVEMYEVEKDWDAKSDRYVRIDKDGILLTDPEGFFDINHYVWGVLPLTIEVVAKGFSTNPSPVISVTCDSQLVGTAMLTTEYAVYAFGWDPGPKRQVACSIQTVNYKNAKIDKLLVKESLPVALNTAPSGYFILDSTVNGPTMTITATAVVTDPDGDAIASYFWDFGDGESYCSGNPVVTHTYDVTTSYSLTLCATDHRGKTAVIPYED
jgi:hypothetical protein